MLSSYLKNLIQNSESWQALIDFKLKVHDVENDVLKRSDDFYFSLFSNAIDLIETKEWENNKSELILLAKGLEIFFLKEKKEYFSGVDSYLTFLLAASLYYLADYPSISLTLIKYIDPPSLNDDLLLFLFDFFYRKLNVTNPFSGLLNAYFETGRIEYLDRLIYKIDQYNNQHDTNGDVILFVASILAKEIVDKFSKNNICHDLVKYNTYTHWRDFIHWNVNHSPGYYDFFPSQKQALENGILDFSTAMSMQMPTSSGKTTITELVIYNEYKNNKSAKILFLAPFRALAYELKKSMIKKLSKYGIKIKTLYGGNIPTHEEEKQIEDSTLIISTPEKFIALENYYDNFLTPFNLVICDEGHLIDDKGRGLEYELLLARIKSYESKKRILFLSAILPNISKINEWLGNGAGNIVESKYRPTQLQYGFLTRNKSSSTYDLKIQMSPENDFFISGFFRETDFKYVEKKSGKEKTLKIRTNATCTIITALKCLHVGTVAVFTTSKSSTIGVDVLIQSAIKLLESGINIPSPVDFADKKILEELYGYYCYSFGTDSLLSKAVKLGILVHHGDLPQNIRECVEDQIKSSAFRLIICTNTIAEGVNLPIKTLVLHSLRRYDEKGVRSKFKALDMRIVKNLIGRAGRAGIESNGLIIATNVYDFEILKNAIAYIAPIDATGVLRMIVKSIKYFIDREKVELTNELLDNSNKSMKEMIDSIDDALIDLLREDITIDDVENIINELLENTFAYFQNDNEENMVLKKLFNLRCVHIKNAIKSGEFIAIKKSGTNFRMFSDIKNIIDIDDTIWIDGSVDFISRIYKICDILFQSMIIQNILNDFFERNHIQFNYKSSLPEFISDWCSGATFSTLSMKYKLAENHILKMVNTLIGSSIQRYLSHLLTVINLILDKNDLAILPDLLNLPNYLSLGLSRNEHLMLSSMGISERDTIFSITNYLTNNGIVIENESQMETYILSKKIDLLNSIKSDITEYSMNKLIIIVER